MTKSNQKIQSEVMSMNVAQLRKTASTLNIKGYGKIKKDQLQKMCIELMIKNASKQKGRKDRPKPGSKREKILETLLSGLTRYKTQAVCDAYWSEVQGVAETYGHLIPDEIKAKWNENNNKRAQAVGSK